MKPLTMMKTTYLYRHKVFLQTNQKYVHFLQKKGMFNHLCLLILYKRKSSITQLQQLNTINTLTR